MQVLVVEDEAMIRMLVCDLLETAGFSCRDAANAVQAIALLDQGRWKPDLLVTDYNLGPGLNGRQLAQEALRRQPGLGIAYITGNPECFDSHAFAPFERLVAKPFAGDELIAAVRGVARRRAVLARCSHGDAAAVTAGKEPAWA